MICKLEKEKMQDRYLFKAKHFNEWHIGNIIKEPDGFYIRDRNKDVMAFINDESTICQCTGLKDKNSKLIWERMTLLEMHKVIFMQSFITITIIGSLGFVLNQMYF